MKVVSVKNASEDLCNLVKQVNNNDEVIFIKINEECKNHNAVLISKETYETVQELIIAMLSYVLDKIEEKNNMSKVNDNVRNEAD